jgi:tetratricopeptide (TPR) repeat protein
LINSVRALPRPAVAALHQRLREDYLPVWIDNLDVTEGLKAGRPWQDGLVEALHAAMCVVWMASPASIRSEWVRAELRRALDLGKLILPYVLDADFASQAEWHDVKTWITPDGVPFGDVQRIMPANLGDELAYNKLASQLREQTRASRFTGFPSSELDIPISGRDDDLRKVETFLREQRRLVVVIGVGGTGKTRLAAEVANRQQHFAHGVIWHKIEPYTRAEDLTVQIRDHLALDAKTPPDEVWSALGRHSVLVVLDNAEACADIPAYAARLQTYDLSNGTRFLMASRAQWQETHLINRTYEPSALTLEAAVQIVRDMAEHHGDPTRLDGREADLARAARLHPRLIQYAVAWLNDLTIGEVLEMLRTLRGGADIEAVMQDILHKTLDQIATQPNGVQAVADLKKLLVCRGGFTRAAADALLGESSRASREILRRWSLLKLNGERYTPDELVEAALTPDASARPAHFDFYLALAKAHDARQDYARLDAESANLAAAFDWALEAGEGEKALALLNASRKFLRNRGRVRTFVAQAERVSAALCDHSDKLIWASAQNVLGVAYCYLAKVEDRAANLRRAVECHQRALQYRTPESAPLDYAETQHNLGDAYRGLAELEDRAANLRRAVECYQRALQYRTPESAPLDYAATQNNFGNAYRALAELEDRAANLRRAAECYQRALVYYTPQSAPLDYAMTQNNLGIAYRVLAELEERAANLRRAVECYQRALQYRTPESAPLDYAATQNNLGNAYQVLAEVEDRAANLRRAVECYQRALQYCTPESAPLDHATTQNNLGIAYRALAEVEDRAASLRRAVECYQRALRYLTAESAPLDYAITQYCLGRAYGALAGTEEHTEGRAVDLRRAIEHYQAALQYLTPKSAPLNYTWTQNGLGNAYRDLAEVEARAENLRRAIECHQRALQCCAPESAPLDYAMTQHNLGLTYKALGDKDKARAAFQEAERYFRRMDDATRADEALRQLRDLEDMAYKGFRRIARALLHFWRSVRRLKSD